MRARIAIAALALAGGLASCSWQEVVNGTTRTHWVVVDTDTTQFDAHAGDQIDVIVPNDTTWTACQRYGGRDLTWSPVTNLTVCEDVDF